MSRRLEDLTPDTQAAAFRALSDLKERGVPCVVTYTFRTYEEQAALYAQGRQPLIEVNALRAKAGLPAISQSENSYTVTKCDGRPTSEGGTGRSAHQLGTAIDVVPLDGVRAVWPPVSDPRWAQIAQAFEAQGFEWGGRWTGFLDLPHYQRTNA